VNDDTIARLVHLAGARARVPPDREQRVRHAVLDECRAVAGRRRLRRRAIAAATALAIAALAVVAVRIGVRSPAAPPPGGVVATVERLEGSGASVRVRERSRPTASLRQADTLRTGDEITTGADGRAALRLTEDISLRLDRSSTARLVSRETIELAAGALYVDSGRESPSLEVRTALGVIRDIGTQFEVRLESNALRIRVRSGIVEVHQSARIVPARAGTEVLVDASGATSRGVAPYGPAWEWASGLAPTFEIEGRPLAAFLAHLCREHGWTLTYSTSALDREASGIILHGSVDGLEPADALEAVLSTSGLAHRLEQGDLIVMRPTVP
jgi:ferric-dicitrate binding protein FerR (iron transport regulator)